MTYDRVKAPIAACLLFLSLYMALPARGDPTASPPPATPAATPASKEANPQAVQAAKAVAAAEDDDPIICKKQPVTGSRVRKEKICKPRSSWAADTKAAKDFLKSIERGTQGQPGGESLPAGG